MLRRRKDGEQRNIPLGHTNPVKLIFFLFRKLGTGVSKIGASYVKQVFPR
jgi:hypothetical protein